MNRTTLIPLLVSGALLVTGAAPAEETATNRLSFSARFGLNISARFKNVSAPPLTAPTSPRTTPDGIGYDKYDDGYVHTDSSGNYGGQTWNWGYDNSASQISGNTILLSRTTTSGAASSSSSFSDDPQLGCELTYNHLLGVAHNAHYGIEAAVNYLNISLHANNTVAGSATRVTDAYPFTEGTTPPGTATGPYQGSFEGPGFLIGDSPVSTTTVVVPGATVLDKQRFDADLWGMRLGPYLEVPLNDWVNLSFSGGLAVGLLDAHASWSQTVGGSGTSGNGDDQDVLWGGYLSASVACRLNEHWSLVGGGQYQTLGEYSHTFGGRRVELDLSRSLFLTVGLGYTF